MAEVLINGVRQGWGDVQFIIGGRNYTGITEFNLVTKQDKGNEPGAGREPVHRSRGGKNYDGASCKLYKYEVDQILALLPEGKDLTDVAPFTVILVFTPIGDDVLRKVIVPMTEFTEMNWATKTGDKNLEINLPLIVGKPIWNKR